jgi:hypothetical protein
MKDVGRPGGRNGSCGNRGMWTGLGRGADSRKVRWPSMGTSRARH